MGEKNVSLEMMKKYLLKKGIKEKDILIDDGAMNTKDQAEHISQMAVYKKWSRIIFIGSSYYQPRAFLTFLKQMKKVKWPGKIINQSALIDLNEKPGGRDKSAKIIINDEIEKIKKEMNSNNFKLESIEKEVAELRQKKLHYQLELKDIYISRLKEELKQENKPK